MGDSKEEWRSSPEHHHHPSGIHIKIHKQQGHKRQDTDNSKCQASAAKSPSSSLGYQAK